MLSNTFSTSEKTFTIVFIILVMAELISGHSPELNTVHYFAKPAIVLSLMMFFWTQSKTLHGVLRYLIMFALLFSLTGDILLMFVEQSPNYFLFGLVTFLAAHVMYIIAFWRDRNSNLRPIGLILLLLVYAFVLFYMMKDGLQKMLIPVIIYMLVILSMATTAFWRREKVSSISYQLVFLGAVLFLVSDSILALNKFYRPIPLSHISIMISYALAQYCIVMGLLKSAKSSSI